MILFPQDPIWFSLKFIHILRNHEKCPYKPSIRQALAICRLIIARFINRGYCDLKDFVEIAVVTSPLENQELARKIANEILSYSNPHKKALSIDELSNLDMLETVNASDLVNEFKSTFDELDEIFDDLNFLERNLKELDDFDWDQAYHNAYDEFFHKFKEDLKDDPFKTALKVIEDNMIANFNNIQTLNDLIEYAQNILRKKINNLEPEDILNFKILDLLDELKQKTEKIHERMGAELAKDYDLKNFEKTMRDQFCDNFYNALKTMDFLIKSEVLDDSGTKLVRNLFEEFLSGMNRDINDFFEAAKTLGENLDLSEEILENLIENSLDKDFEETYKTIKNIDRYFGGHLLDTYMEEISNQLDDTPELEEIRDALINNPTKSNNWRELLSNTIDEELDTIIRENEKSENPYNYIKNYLDKVINQRSYCSDPICKTQLKDKINEILDKTLPYVSNQEDFKNVIEEFSDMGYHLDTNTIKKIGKELGMSESEILKLINPTYDNLRKIVSENQSQYQDYKKFLKNLKLNRNQVGKLVDIAFDMDPPNLSIISAMGETNLADVLQHANNLGNEFIDLAISSLGAGSGLDLLEQWFFSKHNISPRVKEKVKQIIKNIMIDLGIKAANNLIGTSNSGPLVENTVVPYNIGDSFELIDLEDTINNIIESGKTINMITDDDFLVHKTSQGLRCLVLELDISGSMSGEKLAQMALCATMLVYAFNPEELALSFFESNTHKLKDIDEDIDLDQLVEELLDINAYGGTCIRAALDWANDQFEKKTRSKYRLNILFTDADVFDFDDSKQELRKMKDNNVRFVMVVPKFNFSPVLANRMVKMAEGSLLTLDQWRDFPKLISEIISNQ
jgi:uncharacterized protein YegL